MTLEQAVQATMRQWLKDYPNEGFMIFTCTDPKNDKDPGQVRIHHNVSEGNLRLVCKNILSDLDEDRAVRENDHLN